MRKIILTAIATTLLLSGSLFAQELKTSSLAMVKTNSTAKLPKQCQQMFQQADKLIVEAEKQPGSHPQMNNLKNKLTATKQKILSLDSEMQQKSCDKGLVALTALAEKF